MPRQARVVLPYFPHHIVQCGHNKQVVFAQSQDFESYLTHLKELKETFGVKVYAFCLMTNHVHLLLDPGDDVMALGKLMKSLAGVRLATEIVSKVAPGHCGRVVTNPASFRNTRICWRTAATLNSTPCVRGWLSMHANIFGQAYSFDSLKIQGLTGWMKILVSKDWELIKRNVWHAMPRF